MATSVRLKYMEPHGSRMLFWMKPTFGRPARTRERGGWGKGRGTREGEGLIRYTCVGMRFSSRIYLRGVEGPQRRRGEPIEAETGLRRTQQEKNSQDASKQGRGRRGASKQGREGSPVSTAHPSLGVLTHPGWSCIIAANILFAVSTTKSIMEVWFATHTLLGRFMGLGPW